FISQGHNLIGAIDGTSSGFTAGTNNPNGDLVGTTASPVIALLGSLASNGGPTQTLALLPGSLAINAGDNCVVDVSHCGDANIPQLTTDQRGINRNINGVDIGSFESRGFAASLVSGTPQSAQIGSNFAAPLVAAINSSFGEPVAGGIVTFTAPASGPSAKFPGGFITAGAAIGANGQATSPTLTAYGIIGSYNVIGTANGASPSVAFSLTNDRGTPTTTVASSVNPSDLGEGVSFTATVALGANTPTGTVQFKVDNVNFGSPVTLGVDGKAQSATTTTLTTGSRTVTADYNGDSNFNPSSGTLSGGQVVKAAPSLSIDDVATFEGNSGTIMLTFTVQLSAASHLSVKTDYATANDTAVAPADYVAIPTSTLTFAPGQLTKTIAVTVNGDQLFEPDESFLVNLSNPFNATISKTQGRGTITNDDPQGGIISLSQSSYSAIESAGFVTITVNRGADTSFPATVDYATDDTGAPGGCATVNGLASARCDFTTAVGTLSFAAGEAQKTFAILITRDSFNEGPEALRVSLSNLTGGAVFASPSSATVTLTDASSGLPPNAIDDASVFVRQHYHDFLNREPDQSGLQFWTDQINSCASDAACVEVRRINVSAAFYLSIEFQDTGYLVERIYKAAYGEMIGTSNVNGAHQLPVPLVRLNEFLPDAQQISRGVVVLQPGWEQLLESNKAAFAVTFVQRSRFSSAYPTFMAPSEFVDRLYLNAGITPSTTERNAAISEFGTATDTSNITARSRVLRRVADNPTLVANESNRAFVLMQYFGYLRRDPNDAPDSDYTGFDFWLTKLNQFNGDYIKAEMVKAFISSGEYRQRFGN
ncbi:MAG TPA: Calx-beta domain-containing protein, partial [Pyrinomonadaceae bacterium]|nr:Calx-beta domain-containing protein [Pyrinomonadaceae bacterium]